MIRIVPVLVCLGMMCATAALADPPGHAKAGKGRAPGHESGGVSITVQIGESERDVVRDYFGKEVARGKCPPGLAKKNNGCMPPGQAKKWARGRPLPRDVVFYDLPLDLVVRLTAPAGARYVRVAADILLIAVGTGIVLDAVEDLNRL
jgi:Ni/Co efflux regulator RcnB